MRALILVLLSLALTPFTSAAEVTSSKLAKSWRCCSDAYDVNMQPYMVCDNGASKAEARRNLKKNQCVALICNVVTCNPN